MRELLVRLVRLFPAAFRRRFGPDMVEQVRKDYDRARARGRLPALWCALATAGDLVRGAAAERLEPTWPTGPDESPTREDAAMVIGGWFKDLGVTMSSAPTPEIDDVEQYYEYTQWVAEEIMPALR